MDAIDKFAGDETLEELVAAIDRDIAANKPAAALDRLHTYCMKKICPPANGTGDRVRQMRGCKAVSGNAWEPWKASGIGH
jgi:hypothetical protein